MADISLIGVKRDIEIKQGNNVLIHFELSGADNLPLDMTGYDLRLQVRETFTSTSALLNCTIANQKLQWINQSQGKFKLVLLPSDTTALRFSKDSPDVLEGFYDMEIQAPGTDPGTQKPWYGSFIIHREITR